MCVFLFKLMHIFIIQFEGQINMSQISALFEKGAASSSVQIFNKTFKMNAQFKTCIKHWRCMSVYIQFIYSIYIF